MFLVNINNFGMKDFLTIANAFNNYFVVLDRKILPIDENSIRSLQYLKGGKFVQGAN
jgi:hypothetical protein